MNSSRWALVVFLCAVFLIAAHCGDGGSSQTESECTNGLDDDGDGDVDCYDMDCRTDITCRGEWSCVDEIDNDGDGYTDCLDQDCIGGSDCRETACADGIDNDGDGDTDCQDQDCIGVPDCRERACADNNDNDNDGWTDCDDSDCAQDPACTSEPCNHDSDCDAGEDCLWCPDCCACSMTEGTAFEYIVSEMFYPTNATEARTIGVDLDGDNDIDNKLGQILSLMPTGQDPNVIIAGHVQAGRYIMLGRLIVGAWPSDPDIAAQIFAGDTDPTHDNPADNLTGSGHVLIDPQARRDLYLCGALGNGYLDAGPGSLQIPFMLPIANAADVMLLPLERAKLVSEGTVTQNGWTNMMLGGGITETTKNNIFVPSLAAMLNDQIISDPNGSTWQFVRDSIDCACDNNITGCAGVVNGQGDCACWIPPDDPADPVTATELICNALMATALRPDVDTDADQIPDLLSIGMRLQAIPVTIDN